MHLVLLWSPHLAGLLADFFYCRNVRIQPHSTGKAFWCFYVWLGLGLESNSGNEYRDLFVLGLGLDVLACPLFVSKRVTNQATKQGRKSTTRWRCHCWSLLDILQSSVELLWAKSRPLWMALNPRRYPPPTIQNFITTHNNKMKIAPLEPPRRGDP